MLSIVLSLGAIWVVLSVLATAAIMTPIIRRELAIRVRDKQRRKLREHKEELAATEYFFEKIEEYRNDFTRNG